MRRYGSIYVVTNKHTLDQYVGQTIQTVARRWNAHINNSKNPKFNLAKAINKVGSDLFSCTELYIAFDKTELDRAEKEFIESLNATYNMTKGGAGKPDRVITNKQRQITSILSSARWSNPMWKAKTVEAMWGNPEVRAKRSQSIKQRLALPEVRERYRLASLGRKMPANAIEKSAKAKWKPVYCKELQITFLSQKAAAQELGVLTSTIANAVKNKGKVKWQYTLSRVM